VLHSRLWAAARRGRSPLRWRDLPPITLITGCRSLVQAFWSPFTPSWLIWYPFRLAPHRQWPSTVFLAPIAPPYLERLPARPRAGRAHRRRRSGTQTDDPRRYRPCAFWSVTEARSRRSAAVASRADRGCERRETTHHPDIMAVKLPSTPSRRVDRPTGNAEAFGLRFVDSNAR
jgi:hypothetical protein